jgi:hypothetical protein
MYKGTFQDSCLQTRRRFGLGLGKPADVGRLSEGNSIAGKTVVKPITANVMP